MLLPHRLPGPPVEATLIERVNRFLARCLLPSGEEVDAHVPDRGRLIDVLVPGTRVLLFAAPPSPTRKTRCSLLAAWDPTADVLVAIDPSWATTRVRPLIEGGWIPAIGAGWSVRPEVKLGASRIDFRLTRPDDPDAPPLFVEVKNVGVVRNGVALFPDAPTERGTRHLRELEAFARRGDGRAMVLFVAQRADAECVAAHREIDPLFADTLEEVSDVIELAAVRLDVFPEGCRHHGAIPVHVRGSPMETKTPGAP